MCERVSHLRQGENRCDRNVGVARRNEQEVGGFHGLEHTGRGRRNVGAVEPQRIDLVAMAPRDEPFLEGELARRRRDPGPQAIVGRRDDAGGEPKRLRKPRGHDGQRLAPLQGLRAHEVQAEIAIAEPVTTRRRAPRRS